MGEDGLLFARVRPMLADTLLCSSDSPSLRALPLDSLSGASYLLFFDGNLLEKDWTGRSRILHCLTSHSDARRMRPVGTEHGLRFYKHHQKCR